MSRPKYVPRPALMIFVFATMLLSSLSIGGCASSGPARGNDSLAAQPKGLEPALAVAYPSVPIDSDRNGYVDTIDVTAFIFPDQFKHPAPLWIKGQFVFQMMDPDGKLLAQWEFTEEQTGQARRVFPVGRGHWFRLNMLDVGTDKTDAKSASLSCKFIPSSGDAVVEMDRPTSFRLGAG